MTIGERIKQRRKELNISIDTIAEKLNKNRATIYRYESEYIENLPITVLEPLSKVLKCSPAYLMGWEDKAPMESTEEKTYQASSDTPEILQKYNFLNSLGQQKADEYVTDLSEQPKYTE